MNILTDILSLFKRKKVVTEAKDDDVLVLGMHEAPDMEGIASPIPYKSVKLIKVKDFANLTVGDFINVPADGLEAGCYKDSSVDPTTGSVTQNFRRLKSLSLDLTIEENGDYIEFDVTPGQSVLLSQNFVAPQIKFSDAVGEYGIGSETGMMGVDVLKAFDGFTNYDHGIIVGNDMDTRKLPGCASPCPVTISPLGSIEFQFIFQTNLTGVEVYWKLWKLDPDDLGNNGALGTTLTPVTSQGPIAILSDFSSNGVAAYGKEMIVPFTFGAINGIEKESLLFLGWRVDYSGASGVNDYVSINATIRG